MACVTGVALSYSAYIGGLIEMARNKEFRHMRRAALDLLHAEGLTQCGYEDEYCDCREVAVIHDVNGDEDFDYCLRHFEKTR